MRPEMGAEQPFTVNFGFTLGSEGSEEAFLTGHGVTG